jgi:putative lipoic acid-binding regulatory protein
MDQPKIDYPCEWEYRIIAQSEESLRQAVSEVLGAKQYTLSFSNTSKGGKYISFALKTIVAAEKERNDIYVSLRKYDSIKSVI